MDAFGRQRHHDDTLPDPLGDGPSPSPLTNYDEWVVNTIESDMQRVDSWQSGDTEHLEAGLPRFRIDDPQHGMAPNEESSIAGGVAGASSASTTGDQIPPPLDLRLIRHPATNALSWQDQWEERYEFASMEPVDAISVHRNSVTTAVSLAQGPTRSLNSCLNC